MTPTCSIRRLPADLTLEAVDHAVRVNPANGLSIARRIPSPAHLAAYTQKLWDPKDHTFPVQFLDTVDRALIDKFIHYMNLWYLGGSCKQFAYTQGIGEVRITRDDTGYWSYISTDTGYIPENEPTMNFEGFGLWTPQSEWDRVVPHEAGHHLGFEHEHLLAEIIARIDVARALVYFQRTQGWDEQTVYENVLNPLDMTKLTRTLTADEQSVMCYDFSGAITKDGLPIIGGDHISALDQQKANQIYPRATVPPLPPVIPWYKEVLAKIYAMFPWLSHGGKR